MALPLLLSLLVQSIAAEIIPIKVADTKFDPDSTSANIGDILEFQFQPKNHSVVLGDPDKPCQPARNGFYSGFVASDGTFRVLINDTSPLIYYSSQQTKPGHGDCQSGMVGAVNPPDDNYLESYVSAAAKVQDAVSPSSVSGGMFMGGDSKSTAATTTGSSKPLGTADTSADTTQKATSAPESASTDTSTPPTNTSSPGTTTPHTNATGTGTIPATPFPSINGGGRHGLAMPVAGSSVAFILAFCMI